MLHHLENHIERMRQQPDHKKRQYTLFVSTAFTAIIFVFWLASFGVGANVKSEAMAKVQSPLTAMTASASDAFGYVRSLIFGANKVKYSSDNVEVTGGKI